MDKNFGWTQVLDGLACNLTDHVTNLTDHIANLTDHVGEGREDQSRMILIQKSWIKVNLAKNPECASDLGTRLDAHCIIPIHNPAPIILIHNKLQLARSTQLTTTSQVNTVSNNKPGQHSQQQQARQQQASTHNSQPHTSATHCNNLIQHFQYTTLELLSLSPSLALAKFASLHISLLYKKVFDAG